MFSNGYFWIFLALFFIWGPWRYRAWGRRERGGRWGGPDGGARVQGQDRDPEQDRRRDAQVDQLETRVAELESRLDFAERLLAPRRDPAIPQQGTPA